MQSTENLSDQARDLHYVAIPVASGQIDRRLARGMSLMMDQCEAEAMVQRESRPFEFVERIAIVFKSIALAFKISDRLGDDGLRQKVKLAQFPKVDGLSIRAPACSS
jgi:hypothetical protein